MLGKKAKSIDKIDSIFGRRQWPRTANTDSDLLNFPQQNSRELRSQQTVIARNKLTITYPFLSQPAQTQPGTQLYLTLLTIASKRETACIV